MPMSAYSTKSKGLTFNYAATRLADAQRKQTWFGNVRLLPNQEGKTWRDYFDWHCFTCGFQSKSRLGNLLNSVGCPGCRQAEPLCRLFSDTFPSYTLIWRWIGPGASTVSDWNFFVIASDEYASPPRKIRTIRQSICKGWIPGIEFIERDRWIDRLFHRYKETFPAGTIEIAPIQPRYRSALNPHFLFTTGPRALSPPITLTGSKRRVEQLIKREKKHLTELSDLHTDATANGAKVLQICHRPRSHETRIRYRSRSGEIKEQSKSRAINTHWGQGRWRSGETLCFAILTLMFPDVTDWSRNVRPDFLQLRSDNKRSRLELDLYSPSRALALEHQGPHHFGEVQFSNADFSTISVRDTKKSELCKRNNITLLCVPYDDINPAKYLNNIIKELSEQEVFPDVIPAAHEIRKRYHDLQKNPVESQQKAIYLKLLQRGHQLVRPTEREAIWPYGPIRYECGRCGRTITIKRAYSLLAYNVKYGCQKCAMDATQGETRARNLEKVRSQLPNWAFQQLLNNGDGNDRNVITCFNGHRTVFQSLEEIVDRFDQDGNFLCNKCLHPSGSAIGGAQLNRWAEKCLPSVQEKSGLLLIDSPISFIKTGGGRAEVVISLQCPRGHICSHTVSDWRCLFKNKYLTSPVVPYFCVTCAYPDEMKAGHRKVTIWHFLDYIRYPHPNATYLFGAQPDTRQAAWFWCGHYLPNGQFHPPFKVDYDTLRHRRTISTLCYACSAQFGTSTPWGQKSLADIQARMIIISAFLGVLGDGNFGPQVEFSSGRSQPILSTTKTKLKFWCGIPEHKEKITTVDNYFNPSKGYGYCKNCVIGAGIRHAKMAF